MAFTIPDLLLDFESGTVICGLSAVTKLFLLFVVHFKSPVSPSMVTLLKSVGCLQSIILLTLLKQLLFVSKLEFLIMNDDVL